MEGLTGVWVGNYKVAAIGLKIRRYPSILVRLYIVLNFFVTIIIVIVHIINYY